MCCRTSGIPEKPSPDLVEPTQLETSSSAPVSESSAPDAELVNKKEEVKASGLPAPTIPESLEKPTPEFVDPARQSLEAKFEAVAEPGVGESGINAHDTAGVTIPESLEKPTPPEFVDPARQSLEAKFEGVSEPGVGESGINAHDTAGVQSASTATIPEKPTSKSKGTFKDWGVGLPFCCVLYTSFLIEMCA